MSGRKSRSYPEDDLAILVADFLRAAAPHLVWSHIPNGGKRNVREAVRFKRMGVLPGFADLIFVWDMRCWFIELKSATGSQTTDQRGFEGMVKAEGCKYEVCRSLDEVAETLVAWGLLPERVLGGLVS